MRPRIGDVWIWDDGEDERIVTEVKESRQPGGGWRIALDGSSLSHLGWWYGQGWAEKDDGDEDCITQAAILVGRRIWTLPPPTRHHDLLTLYRNSTRNEFYICHQGFMTKRGRFVTRKIAALIARDAGQIGYGDKLTDPQDELFSEDLW